MVNVSEELKTAFLTGNQKYLTLNFNDGSKIESDRIVLESLKIDQQLFTGELRFGQVSASKFEVQIYYDPTSHINTWVTPVISTYGDDGNYYEYQLGVYHVIEDNVADDHNTRTLIAYDKLYEVVNGNYADWYKSLALPMTLRQFRDAFFRQAGINQIAIDLPNDSVTIEKTIAASTLSGSSILQAIMEINAAFGFIDNQGNFKYVLHYHGIGLYPAEDLYPADDLYPVGNGATYFGDEAVGGGVVLGSLVYRDYYAHDITGVLIRQDDEDAGTFVGTKGNQYTILGNFLLFGKDYSAMTAIGNKFLEYADELHYIPCSFKSRCHPWLELGDILKVEASGIRIAFPIAERTMSGVTAFYDTYKADGTEYYAENANSLTNMVENLRSKTLKIVQSIDEVSTEITDLQSEDVRLSSRIKQTAASIELSTKDHGTYAGIVIKVRNEDGTELDSESANITMNGMVKFVDLKNQGATVINGANITTGDIYCHNDNTGYWTRIATSTGNLSWNMAMSKLNTRGELSLMYNDGQNSYEALLLTAAYWNTKPNKYGASLNASSGASFVAFGTRPTAGGDLSFPLVLNFGLDPEVAVGHATPCTDDIICYGTVGVVGSYSHGGTTDLLYASISPMYVQNYDQDYSNGMCLNVSFEHGDAVTINGYMVLTVETFTSLMRAKLMWDNGGADNAYGIKFAGTYADTTNKEQEGSSSMQMDPEYCTYACTVLEAYFLANVLSDRRIKKDIREVENKYIGFYEDLNPVEFKYQNEKIAKVMKSSKNNKSRLGFIAQDIVELLNKHHIDDSDITCQMEGNPNAEIDKLCEGEVYKLNYDDFHALHVQYAHHLKERIDELEKKNAELEERLARLESLINK